MHPPNLDHPPNVDLETVRTAVLSTIARERGVAVWLRELPTERRIAVALLAVVATLLVPLLFVHLDPSESRWGARSIASFAVYAAILLALLRSALRPLQSSGTRALDPLLVAMGLAAPFVLAMSAPGGASEPLHRLGYCFFIGTAVGWGLLLLVRALDRRSHDRRAEWLAVAVAAVATNFALQFDCPDTGVLHRLTCHATLGGALALQYLLVRRAVVRRVV